MNGCWGKMHPRKTRSRPLLLLEYPGYKIFINNICSPLVYSLSKYDSYTKAGLKILSNASTTKEPIWTDAVSCCYRRTDCYERLNGNVFKPFLVEFWLETLQQCCSVVAVEVFVPSGWTVSYFLEVFTVDLRKHSIVTVVNTYFIDGKKYPFNMINTIHHSFFSVPVF